MDETSADKTALMDCARPSRASLDPRSRSAVGSLCAAPERDVLSERTAFHPRCLDPQLKGFIGLMPSRVVSSAGDRWTLLVPNLLLAGRWLPGRPVGSF